MRWPFRSKSSPSTGGESPAASDESHAPAFAASRPGSDWLSLPPAPIAVSARAPRTIVGSASAIRGPIGLRERTDVSAFAAAGVVDGLARVLPHRSDTYVARPEPPIGEASALPAITARALRAIASSQGSSSAGSTTSASVAIARPPAEPSRPSAAATRGPAVPAPSDGDGDLALPHRSSLAQSRRLGLGPGYHGPLPDAMRQDRLERAAASDDDAPAAYTERVPDDLRTIMRNAYGVDVGDQVVHRGSDVTDEARQLGARAFARDGEVFVPIDAGPLDEARAKSLLAHELTHAAQQRRRTAPLPADGSVEGLALEAEAQRAERFVRGDPGAPAPGPMALEADVVVEAELIDTQRFVSELVHRGVAEPDGTGGVRFLWGHGGGGRVQRATEPAGPVGAAASQENWDTAAVFGQSLAESFNSDFEDMIGGEFSFVTGLQDEITSAHDAREREFRREQTKEAFSRLRLEHLRVGARQNVPTGVLSEEREKQLEHDVAEEVRLRTQALEDRVKHQLDLVNEQLKTAEKAPQRELDPDRYDVIFNKLFAEPEGKMPDDEAPADVKAHADDVVNKAKAKQPPATAPKPGGPPAAGGPGGAKVPGGPVTPGASTAPGRPLGGPLTPSGDKAPEIDSAEALKGAFVTDLVTLEAGEFGITLTDDELKGLYQPAADAKAAPAKPADGSTPPTTPSPTGAPTPGGAASDKKNVGPSGHEKIDIDRLDLEELTKRIFPRLRSSLRQELLVDRERAGRLNH